MANKTHTLISFFSNYESCADSLENLKRSGKNFGFLNFACDVILNKMSDLTVSSVAKVLELYLEDQDKKISLSVFQNASKREKDEELFEFLYIFKKNWNEACFQSKIEFVDNKYAEIKKTMRKRKNMLGNSSKMPEVFVSSSFSSENLENSAVKNFEVDPYDVAWHDVPLWMVAKDGPGLSVNCVIVCVVTGAPTLTFFTHDDCNSDNPWFAVDLEYYVDMGQYWFFSQKKDALAKLSSIMQPSRMAVEVWQANNNVHRLSVDWKHECESAIS